MGGIDIREFKKTTTSMPNKRFIEQNNAFDILVITDREVTFYTNCVIFRALIGSFLLSVRVRTNKILIYASFEVQLAAVKLSTFKPMRFN